MKLNVISPAGQKNFDITWIEITTPSGNLVILEEHAPMIIELMPEKEVVYQLINGKQESFAVNKGFAHVSRNQVELMIDQLP